MNLKSQQQETQIQSRTGMKNSMNPIETNRSTKRKMLSGLEEQNEQIPHLYSNIEEGMITNPKNPVVRAREQT